jgi:uncharacterized protein (DUF1684 family)
MSISLLDWRRQVAELYRVVRSNSSPQEAHSQWRARRDELFATHPASPLPPAAIGRFSGLPYGPYDSAFRFEVPVDTDLPPRDVTMVSGPEATVSLRRLGRVRLGTLGELDLWWLAGYAGGLFLPFTDPSTSSYPGGRYVLDTAKGADLGGDLDPVTQQGSLVVDLNFAYNPSCAYDASWACPLAPIGNQLLGPVDAGERLLSPQPGPVEPP